MKIFIVRRKASSYRDLSRAAMEVGNPGTLRELLMRVMENEIVSVKKQDIPNVEELEAQAKSGRIGFGNFGELPDISKSPGATDGLETEKGSGSDRVDAMAAMKATLEQDFSDGLFRVYINDKEYTDLDARLTLTEGDTLVLVKLVMLTGRLW